MKIIGIIGSRRRDNSDDYKKVLQTFNAVYNDGDEIVSGGCPKGGDRFAEEIAESFGIPIKIYYPNWRRYGKTAGFNRNTYIARDATILIACVAEDRTGGTEDTIEKFRRAHSGNEVILV